MYHSLSTTFYIKQITCQLLKLSLLYSIAIIKIFGALKYKIKEHINEK